MGCKVVGWGKALPELVVTNDDLAQIVETSDQWIVERTGIHQRHIARTETTTDLACEAGQAALTQAGYAPDSIDLLICMTITPDSVVPAESCLIKARLGLTHAVAFDLNAACSGCIYGIDMASTLIEASALSETVPAPARPRNRYRRALVIGAERLSRIVDWTDRATCVLFGDGAGAVVLEWDTTAPGVLSSFLKNTDDPQLTLACDTVFGPAALPFTQEREELSVRAAAGLTDEMGARLPHHPYIAMQGQAVFKFATAAIVEAAQIACERAGVSLDDIACIVPHQANERIIRYAAKKLGVPLERFQISIGEVGNTSASSVLMALTDAYQTQRIQPGDKVLLVGFGGGLTSGALVFEA